jgi:molybdenum ABC transporter molybdate-binding protein
MMTERVFGMLLCHLQKRMPHFQIDVHLEIGAETWALIGHSGCGKSTTLRMLSGLVTPDDGFIQLQGRYLFDRKKGIDIPPENRGIGFVLQNYALFPHLSVVENIGYGLSHLPKEEREKRVAESLNLLGIEHLAHSKPSHLSGGEQQRVALARAWVTRPKLLLLDEPLSALDVSTRSRVRAELKTLLRTLSIPTIVVTHDYEDARVLGDRIAVMDRGRIVQTGTPAEIAKYPVNRFVAAFSGTNVVPVREEEQPASVAFDPWKVIVSSHPLPLPYQWSGTIRDIAWMGGFVRLHIEGEHPLLADIPVEEMETNPFSVGDRVYAGIHTDDARKIPSILPMQEQESEALESVRATLQQKKRKKRKWKWAVAMISLFTAAGVFAGYMVTRGAARVGEKKTEMPLLIAANATDPINKAIATFTRQHPDVSVKATFAGTQVIRTQLEQGAPADLLLTADLGHIEAIRKEGLIDSYVPVSHSHEVIVVPKNNPAGIRSLQDLETKPVRLIIGVDTVPIGKYTRQMFANAEKDLGPSFTRNVLSHVVDLETNVKQILQKVAMGEADAGIVYRSDVTADLADRLALVEIPQKYNVTAVNYIAVPKRAPHPDWGRAFMQFLLSPKGQDIFAEYGYDPMK